MPDDWKIGATTVHKHARGLALSAHHRSEIVSCGIEHQRASLREDIWTNSEPRRCWHSKNQSASGLVDIGLNPRESRRLKKLLALAIVAVDGLSSEPAVEMVAVSHQEPASFGASL